MTQTETSVLQPAALPASRLRVQLGLFFIARMVMNTGFRMVYPFLPEIARGLGVSLAQVTLGITARSTLGLFSPLFGSAADTLGRKVAMLLGMLVFVLGMLLVYISPTYPALIIALILTTVSKILFDLAIYAYLGDHVSYKQRGLAVAVVEFGWSGGFLLGVPLVGWLIERGGWSAPFPWLALVGVGMIALVWRTVPTDSPRGEHKRPSLMKGLKSILTQRVALAGLSLGVFISTGNEVVNVIYGAWLENSFGLKVGALGVTAAVIGIAELVGEGGVAGFVDRLGKRRSVGIGLALSAVSCLLLPLLASSINGALLGLFLFYFTFEFTIVASLPLMTELVPAARATFMSVNAAGHSLGRVIGSLVGPALFASGIMIANVPKRPFNGLIDSLVIPALNASGLPVNAVFAAVVYLIALVVLVAFVRENHDPSN